MGFGMDVGHERARAQLQRKKPGYKSENHYAADHLKPPEFVIYDRETFFRLLPSDGERSEWRKFYNR